MTCIAGAVDSNGTVVIGGDSAGIAYPNLQIRADEKVFVTGEFAFGFTDSFRMGQLIRYKFLPPPIPENADLFAYMVNDFADQLRSTLKGGGFAKKESEVESGGTFLVGFRGRLFCIESDYQIEETTCGFNAVGCGSQVAMGAMFSIREKTAKEKVMTGLQAAEAFSAGVRAPFVIKQVPTNG